MMTKAVTKRGLPRRRVGPGAPLSERILLHTDRSNRCWIWTAAIDKRNGYGRLTVGGKNAYSHRVSYEAFVGPIPAGMEIDHLCRVTSCCRPDHLEAVTPSVNVRRGDSPGAKARRRELCLYGVHSYEEFGLIDSTGRRTCAECNRVYLRLRKKVPYAEAMRRKSEGIPVVDLAAHYAEEAAA